MTRTKSIHLQSASIQPTLPRSRPRTPDHSPAHPLLRRYGPAAAVTGASSGLGLALAAELAEAGFQLALIARSADALHALARRLPAPPGRPHIVIAADLADPAQVAAVLTQLSQHDIGLLIAAAGFGRGGSFLDAELDVELEMIDVNCRAVAAMTWQLARQMLSRSRPGGIMLFSSIVAFQGVPRAANYAATKAYIQSLAEALHHELARHDIDVLAVAPGPVHSGFAARAGMTMGLALQPKPVARAALRALGRRATCRPGWLSKALELALKTLPRWGRVRMMAQVMRGMTPRLH